MSEFVSTLSKRGWYESDAQRLRAQLEGYLLERMDPRFREDDVSPLG